MSILGRVSNALIAQFMSIVVMRCDQLLTSRLDSFHTTSNITMGWQETAKSRRTKQQASIPKEWLLPDPLPSDLNVLSVPVASKLLTPREIEITDTDFESLLSNLTNGLWTSVEVVSAFYKRAIIAHQLTNCLTEIFIDEALQRAAQVDAHFATTGKPIGPLHGLPISLKDQFSLKGRETIMGYVSWIGKPADRDAAVVEILYEAGAVPFVRTNVPQTLMWCETFNNVFGRTLNPYNRTLTSGGSSGGESALLALHGSPLGLGTDIGGSLRVPTSFCALYALRPSMHRLPYGGLVNSSVGQESIHSVIGPMAPSLAALRIFTKTIIDAKPWEKDPACLRIPWDPKQSALGEHGGPVGRLCFAIMWDNGVVAPTPPVKRAMEITKKALEDAGHTVVDWTNHRHFEIYTNTANGGEDFARACAPSGEPYITSMLPSPSEAQDFNYLFGKLPTVEAELLKGAPISLPLALYSMNPQNVTEEAITKLKREYAHENDAALGPPDVAMELPRRSAFELWQLHAKRRELQKSYLDHWNATKDATGTGRPVDAIISPVAPYPAAPHGYNSDVFYTSMWNGLDYTACTFPVTTVDPELDVRVPRLQFHNYEDEHIHRWYDARIFKGAPVGLQLVGRTHEEEAVLAMTEVVDAALKKFQPETSRL
ncbi:general amidase [Clavulina sp. PMI_390]|nr:general amidase [Clavulina sp. PMI_390]